MDWSQTIVTILGTGSLAGIIASVAVWLAKSLIEEKLRRGLAEYTIELQKVAFEHQTRFTELHKMRAEVINELYKRMVRAQRNFEELIKPFVLAGEKTPDEKQKALVENANQFLEYMAENRLYLGDDLYAKLEKLWQEMVKTFYGFTVPGPMNATAEENFARWDKTWQQVTVEFRKMEQEIESDFRQMLGDRDSSKRGA